MTDQEKFDAAQALIDKMKAMMAEKEALLDQLERRLAFARLWPALFKGSAFAYSWSKPAAFWRPTKLVMSITFGDETRTFPQEKVPQILWTPEMRAFAGRTRLSRSHQPAAGTPSPLEKLT